MFTISLFDDVTTQDFIDLYEETEAIEITNLYDELATTINQTKLNAGLANAKQLVFARFLQAGDCGRALIVVARKQLVLWIMRYILDTVKARPFVNEDYQKAMEYLEFACEGCLDRCPLSLDEIELILGQRVTTRSRLRCSSGYTSRQVMSNIRFDPEKIDLLLGDENPWR